jgi:hypothetical protein
MYSLMDKTYLGELITTSSLQSQHFVNTLIVIDTKRVDGVKRELLEARQC